MKLDKKVFEKDHLKIIITDSGLGGLAVQALLDKELRKRKINSNVELIFFNSVVHHDYGYNQIKNHDEKVRTFDSALSGMLKFNPDVILIACNTLSVLYYYTQTSKSIKIPVLGIVESGIELVLDQIKKDSNIILFGTETTIASGKHKEQLLANGIASDRIISQACNYLESEIQIDPTSKSVKQLVEKFNDQAYDKITNTTGETLAVLCCTHYGYSKEIFNKALDKKTNNKAIVLDPNKKMAAIIASEFAEGEKENPNINNKVYSKVDITKSEMSKLSKLLSKDSKGLSGALKNYIWDEDLFIGEIKN